MNKNDIITLKIEDMGIDGEGIGKIDGMTFFVKDAVIGDEIEVFGPGRDFFSQTLDFMQDDAGMMETLFRTLACSWTDGLVEIQRACHYYIIHNGSSSQEEKEQVGWAIRKWTVMAAKIELFSRLISEKLYYYEQISSELEEIMMIKAKNAVA